MIDPIYLDNNATTRPLPEVVDAMVESLRSGWANPSSVHRLGTAARRQVELSRESVATLLGCQDREIVFTSGGTESANFAIFGTLEWARSSAPQRRLLLTSRLEHSAIRESAEAWSRRGGEILWAEHRPNGVVDCDWLDATLRSRAEEIALVSLMWVNNETGVVSPVERIGSLCQQYGVRFHCDATQAVGRHPIDLASMQMDLVTFAAHKFHGPKGVGGLYVRRGIRLLRQAIGGPQERDRRGGTENVPGIVGMGVAAASARRWLDRAARDTAMLADAAAPSSVTKRPTEAEAHQQAGSDALEGTPSLRLLEARRDRFEAGLRQRCPDLRINAVEAPRLWTTSNIAFPRLEAEAILLLLSERGVCASAGAACSSGSLDPSPVLLAMGIEPAFAHGSVRFSFARTTTDEEISRAIEIVPACIQRLASSSSAVL